MTKQYPLHHEDARPMFATVETDYLDQLNEGQRLLQSLTINREHLELVRDSLNKARTKHPKFCDELCAYSKKYADQKERELKRENELDEKAGCVYASSILEEEMYELFHEMASENKKEAKEEAADCIAVLVRLMEELDK